MKVAAVVILYSPPASAIDNILSYYDKVDKLYVFDNSSQDWELKNELLKLEKVEFFQDYENKGIARRLNQACKMAGESGYDWLLTMDQDTSFSPASINAYLSCFEKIENRETVAAVGLQFSGDPQPVATNCQIKEIEKLITSGMLVNLALVDKVGGFDEALFIDTVDYDYCFRARMAGFKIIELTGIFILHPIGNIVRRSSIKTLFLVKKKKQIHSALRCYYMYRNMLYLKDRYGESGKPYTKQIEGYVWSRIKVCILYGRNTLEIVEYLVKAQRDYRSKRMGRIGESR